MEDKSTKKPQEEGEEINDLFMAHEHGQLENIIENERIQLQTLISTIPDLIWLKDLNGAYLTLNRSFEELIGFSASEAIGKTDYDLFPKELADFFRENDTNAAKANKPTTNLEELTFAANGYRGLFETIKTPMYNNSGTMIGILGVARDITNLKRAEEEVVAVNNQLSILVNAIQELSFARDLESIMKIVRTHARQLVGADGATFVLRDGDRCFYADEDAIEPLWKGQRFPLEECISGWSMLNKQQVVIEDIYVDPRIPVAAYKPTFVKSLAMIPIRIANPIGAIGAYWATNHTATASETELLQTLADTTTRAIENVQLLDELDQRVKERTTELEQKNSQLERMNKLFIGRELRMAELKKEIKTLEEKLQNRGI